MNNTTKNAKTSYSSLIFLLFSRSLFIFLTHISLGLLTPIKVSIVIKQEKRKYLISHLLLQIHIFPMSNDIENKYPIFYLLLQICAGDPKNPRKLNSSLPLCYITK